MNATLQRLVQEPSATLRNIKNDLTGQELRKIEYIRAGLIPTLVEILQNARNTHYQEDATWSDAASVVAVIANNGPAFTHPVLQSDLIQLFLDQLRDTPTGSRLELAILRCLNSVANNLPLQPKKDWTPDQTLPKMLYVAENALRLVAAISVPLDTFHNRRVIEAALSLICKTCPTERQKTVLVDGGLVQYLANHLATISATLSPLDRLKETPDVRQNLNLTCLVLEVTCAVCELSRTNTEHLTQNINLARTLDAINAEGPGLKIPYVQDSLADHAARRSNFPPLNTFPLTHKKRAASLRQDSDAMVLEDDDDTTAEELQLVLWLLQLSRISKGRNRVLAMRLLGILRSYGMVHPARARSFAALVVPLLVNMIDTRKNTKMDATSGADLVPSTLAIVVKDSEYLQEAAVESMAIPKLAAALKSNFETTQELETGIWWPQKVAQKLTEGEPRCRLGHGGPTKQLRLNMHIREGLLQALASLAPSKDSHRKEICEQGALAQIVMALEPFSCLTIEGVYGDALSVHGNSSQALIAACNAVRALTRSATALRTKLVDADVAKSILQLLQTGEPEVRIAATMVAANLAHDFSPMKPSIGDHVIIKKLCEQAHSANARLRRESLFALKALVNNSTKELKEQVLDELGPSWIKQLVGTDPYDIPSGEVIGLVPKEYRKGSMVRVSDEEGQPQDADMDLDFQDQEYTRHTLQEDLDIQAELLGFLRNLTTGESPFEIIKYLLEDIGQEDFIHILLDRLHSLDPRRTSRKLTVSTSASPPSETVENSLYILAHMCAADQRFRHAICYNSTLMKQVALLLHSNHQRVRCAACWLIINLVYPTPTDGFDTTAQRAKELHKLGIVSHLRRMESTDTSPDVVERVKTALDCFDKMLDRR